MMRFAVVLLMVMVLAPPAEAQRRRRAVSSPPPPQVVVVNDDFLMGNRGWRAGFADYSPVNGDMELMSGLAPLPPSLGVTGMGFVLIGHNRSDDLFMFLTKKLTAADGIWPNKRYEVSYRLVIASNAGGDACAGIGGHPGYSVYLKAGASEEEPRVELDATNHYRLTVDKGNQSVGGSAASVVGDISTGSDNCSESAPYKSLERVHRHTSLVQADAFGELWLLVGTDSGFEGKTTLYYQAIVATLTPMP
jgi:hypothetical protein